MRVVEKLDLPVIEDNVYGFLDHEIAPLAALAPDRCIVIDSLSKKVAPGLALGFVVPPRRLRESVMAAVRSGGWTASGFAFAAAQRMMGDGTVAELSRLKRIDARARQKLAIERLVGVRHPDQWKMLSSVADAAAALALADLRRGRGPARHRADALDDVCHHARPRAERGQAGLGGAGMDQLDDGLRTLAALLNASEHDFEFDGMSVRLIRASSQPSWTRPRQSGRSPRRRVRSSCSPCRGNEAAA